MTKRRTLYFAIPGDIETRSGGYAYDRAMIGQLRALGWEVVHLPLAPSFPRPDAAALRHATATFADLADGSLVLVDGLALGAMPDIAQDERHRLRLVALVHHPLAREDAAGEAARALVKSEKRALAASRAVVVTGKATALDLAENFAVARDRITIVPPGTEPGRHRAAEPGEIPLILSVGTLTARKDHATLVAALALLREKSWRCRIVGSAARDPATVAELQHAIEAAKLTGRIDLVGEVETIADEYSSADIFALASRHEGFGMAFAEALAHGLPIVGCAAGAVPDLVPVEAGVLVAPGDAQAFAQALGRLLEGPHLRLEMGRASVAAGRKLATWEDGALRLSDVLDNVSDLPVGSAEPLHASSRTRQGRTA